MEKHVEYVGDDITHNFTSGTTPAKCQGLCQRIDECVGFTFDEKDFGEHRCELKSLVENRKPSMRPSPFLISGPKYCVGKTLDKLALFAYHFISYSRILSYA